MLMLVVRRVIAFLMFWGALAFYFLVSNEGLIWTGELDNIMLYVMGFFGPMSFMVLAYVIWKV